MNTTYDLWIALGLCCAVVACGFVPLLGYYLDWREEWK